MGGGELDLAYIAERVRLSGRANSSTYSGLTGIMPFWGADRISDAELFDVVAFVNDVSKLASPVTDGGMGDGGTDGGMGNGGLGGFDDGSIIGEDL
ncbi:MAG: hypothetical protein AAGF12_43075 [Myxococcota bacterium]